MWLLLIISFQAGTTPIVTTVQDFASKRSCLEMQEVIKEKLHRSWPNIEMSCVYSED